MDPDYKKKIPGFKSMGSWRVKEMEYTIAAISGDGIGPEIVREAKKVLDKIGQKYGHKFNYEDVLMGGISIDTYGVPLTDEALETAKKSDAVLLGAVGGNVGNSRWRQVFLRSAKA